MMKTQGDNKFYHYDCFTCSKCPDKENRIGERPFTRIAGEFVCQKCYKVDHPDKECNICGEVSNSEYFIYQVGNSQSWHPDKSSQIRENNQKGTLKKNVLTKLPIRQVFLHPKQNIKVFMKGNVDLLFFPNFAT